MNTGPALLALITVFLKNYYVSFSFTNFAENLVPDLLVPGILLLLISNSKPIILLSSFISLWYFADAVTIYLVNGRLTLSHILEFGGAVNFYRPFLPMLLLAPLLVLLLKIKANLGWSRLIAGSTFLALSLTSDSQFDAYASNPLLRREAGRIDSRYSSYTPIEIPKLTSPNEPFNLVIILVEGFSAIYSRHYNNRNSLVPRLDDLAEEGLIFEHFLANGDSTDMGVLSVLQGDYPFRRISSGRNLYADSSVTPGIIDQLKEFKLIRIDGAHSLGLRAKDYFVKKKFDQVIDSQDKEWLPDAIVFDHILKSLSLPTFVIASTMSTHPPYKPLGGEGGNGMTAAWNYFDESIYDFIKRLKETHHWRSTIVAITGDHRAREPLSEGEIKLFGSTAYNRVPLFILGGKIKPKKIKTPSQQVDLISNIFDIVNQKEVKSSPLLVVNRIQRGEIMRTDGFTLFIDEKAYDGYAEGTEIFWQSLPPIVVDHLIHRSRSQPGTNPAKACPAPPDKIIPSDTQGIAVHSTSKENFILPNLDLPATNNGIFGQTNFFTAKLDTFLSPPNPGDYVLRFIYDDGICVWLNGDPIVQDWTGGDIETHDVLVRLDGLTALQIDYLQASYTGMLRMFWRRYGEEDWSIVDDKNFYLPKD